MVFVFASKVGITLLVCVSAAAAVVVAEVLQTSICAAQLKVD